MKAIKHIETKRDGEIEIITNLIKNNVKISEKVMDYIIETGDRLNYESVIYHDISENIFFNVDDLIEYLIEEPSDEDFENDIIIEVIKELEQWKGWTLMEE